jgi:hypothetical protein
MSIAAVETLEVRTLMSVTLASLTAQVSADVVAINASISAAAAKSTKDQHTLAAILHPLNAANSALLKTLGQDYKSALAILHTMQKITTTIGADTKHAELAVLSALNHKMTAKAVAQMNAALGKLSKEDNYFVSPAIFNAFYNAVPAPGNEEITIGSSNEANAALSAALPAIEADARELQTTSYAKFNALVMDVSAFATAIVDNVSGAVF